MRKLIKKIPAIYVSQKSITAYELTLGNIAYSSIDDCKSDAGNDTQRIKSIPKNIKNGHKK
jgi:hypothetical protein